MLGVALIKQGVEAGDGKELSLDLGFGERGNRKGCCFMVDEQMETSPPINIPILTH